LVSLTEIGHLEDVVVDGRILNYILNVGWKGRTGFLKQMILSEEHHLRNPVDLDYLAEDRNSFVARLDKVMGRQCP
jgi:hypothetical protein